MSQAKTNGWLPRALGGLVLLAAALPACDRTVFIYFFENRLSSVENGGYAYHRAVGQACSFNKQYVDLDLLPRITAGEGEKLAVPGDLLANCVLAEGEVPDGGGTCYLGSQDVTFDPGTSIQWLGIEGCNTDADCAGIDGTAEWKCAPDSKRCEAPFTLKAREGDAGDPNPAFLPVGTLGRPRLVALVLDHSGSLSGENGKPTDFNGQRVAANISFVRSLGPADRVGVFAFNKVGVEDVDFVSKLLNPGTTGFLDDKDRVAAAIGQLSTGAQGGTQAWDAIVRAARELRKHNLGEGGFNPVIVLFTDGLDPDTTTSAQDARNELLGASPTIPLFVVHLENAEALRSDGNEPEGPIEELQALACESGGGYFYATNPDAHLTHYYQKVLPDITLGRWRVQASYSDILATGGGGQKFPAGRYAIRTTVSLTVEGVQRSAVFGMSVGGPEESGRPDSRIFVERQDQ